MEKRNILKLEIFEDEKGKHIIINDKSALTYNNNGIEVSDKRCAKVGIDCIRFCELQQL